MQIKRVCLWLLVILIAGLIFFFSAMNGPDSMELSSGFTVWFMHLFHPDYESMSPEKQKQIYQLFVFIVRKMAHFTEFAALGMSLILLLREYRLPHAAKWAWAIGTFYAGTDELHQYFNGTRTPSLRDVAIDSAGVVFGVMVMILLWYLIRQIKSKQHNKIE